MPEITKACTKEFISKTIIKYSFNIVSLKQTLFNFRNAYSKLALLISNPQYPIIKPSNVVEMEMNLSNQIELQTEKCVTLMAQLAKLCGYSNIPKNILGPLSSIELKQGYMMLQGTAENDDIYYYFPNMYEIIKETTENQATLTQYKCNSYPL